MQVDNSQCTHFVYCPDKQKAENGPDGHKNGERKSQCVEHPVLVARETDEWWKSNGNVVEHCQGYHWTDQREGDDSNKGDSMVEFLFLLQCSLSKEGEVKQDDHVGQVGQPASYYHSCCKLQHKPLTSKS